MYINFRDSDFVGLQGIAIAVHHAAVSQIELHLVDWARDIGSTALHDQIFNVSDFTFGEVSARMWTSGTHSEELAPKAEQSELPSLHKNGHARFLLHANQCLGVCGAQLPRAWAGCSSKRRCSRRLSEPCGWLSDRLLGSHRRCRSGATIFLGLRCNYTCRGRNPSRWESQIGEIIKWVTRFEKAGLDGFQCLVELALPGNAIGDVVCVDGGGAPETAGNFIPNWNSFLCLCLINRRFIPQAWAGMLR
mmetsp:Transcript_11565/g.21869  ORF Transcript_11565/g.21869 Transcript_11565/m.21869 type:complete len:248 (+) Transcript_11565:170-913(+)